MRHFFWQLLFSIIIRYFKSRKSNHMNNIILCWYLRLIYSYNQFIFSKIKHVTLTHYIRFFFLFVSNGKLTILKVLNPRFISVRFPIFNSPIRGFSFWQKFLSFYVDKYIYTLHKTEWSLYQYAKFDWFYGEINVRNFLVIFEIQWNNKRFPH